LEILFGFYIVVLAFISNFTSFASLVVWQPHYKWNFLLFLPILPILFVAFLLETNRIPFDVSEAESELVSGYTVEYGGFFFVLFYLSEYFHLYCFASVYAVCFFGAWHL
jgi:NADH-quinone oxidoreductase subunit H